MDKFKLGIVAALITGAGVVHAAPTWGTPGINEVYFQNFENAYRASGACVLPDDCLAAAAGDPAGFLRVNPLKAGNVKVNDVFIGIFNVQNIDFGGNTIWTQDIVAPQDRFTGYFVQRVAAINLADPTKAVITLGTTADPFGKLGAGEMIRLYSDTPGFISNGGIDVSSSIATATSGTFWAGLGLASEGYAYTTTDLTTTITDSDTETFLAFDVLSQGPGYNAGSLSKVNDFNEDLFGGSILDTLICSAVEIADPTKSCTDVVGTGEIEENTRFVGYTGTNQDSPWMYASNDPLRLNTQEVPEPATLALVGLALAGMGIVGRRRQRA